ncbi:uncharacterized protein AKAME5_002224600 [Lates japonicus]|uniref:Uncharacterized protein n=1 Tax=Lates japonicus TaxID=270547 RepID=A0AAD3NFI1_LATJO|nr:uncharacterized protein AKAME5_002224600 [Lates japonicus]
MLLKKNCGGKTRTIKIRNLTGSRPPPRYTYDPSIFAFRSLSTVPPLQSPDPVRRSSLLIRKSIHRQIIPPTPPPPSSFPDGCFRVASAATPRNDC